MRQPAEGTYDAKRIDLVGFSTWSARSAFSDEDASRKGRALAEAMLVKGRAGAGIVPQLASMCTELVRRNPRRITARMKPDASVMERLSAAASMGSRAGRAFADGQSADIGDRETMSEISAAVRAQGERGPLSEKMTDRGRVVTAILDFPEGAETLCAALADALASRHGCIVVREAVAGRPDRIHLGIWSASPKSHIVAASDRLSGRRRRFTLAAQPHTLHPLAWAVLQPTFRPTGANELKAPSPLRGRAAEDVPIKAYRDAWRNADRLNTAFSCDNHNDVCRAREQAIALPEELPDDDIMSEVLDYVARVAPAMKGVEEHLRRLTSLKERLADLG